MIESMQTNSLNAKPTMAEIVSGWSATLGQDSQVQASVPGSIQGGSSAAGSSVSLQGNVSGARPTMAELVMGFASSQAPEAAVEGRAPFTQSFEMLTTFVQQIVTATVTSVLQALGIAQNSSSNTLSAAPGQSPLPRQSAFSDTAGIRDIISLFKEAAPVAKDVLLNLGQGVGGALSSAGAGLGSGIGGVLGGVASVFGLK